MTSRVILSFFVLGLTQTLGLTETGGHATDAFMVDAILEAIEAEDLPPAPAVGDAEREMTFHSRRYLRRHSLLGSSPGVDNETVTEKWFEQDLDHFHPTDRRTWKQRYFVNDTSYQSGGPVFLMIGGEGEANSAWMSQGTWVDYAQQFGAMRFMLEHRFYGKSHPTPDMSVKSLAFLSSEQALADLATFIAAMNEEYKLPPKTKWIAFGGSYPGALAAWLRLKYPHLLHGAVSTSGPFLAKANFFEYLEVVSNSLNVTNPKCDPDLREAVSQVGMLTQHRVGWNRLAEDFKLCSGSFDGTKQEDVANFFETVVGNFEDVVQYNKDNREFEGAKNTNVTIETLCDIMTASGFEDGISESHLLETLKVLNAEIQRAEHPSEVSSSFEGISDILHGVVSKTAYQRLVDVNSFVLSMNGEKCLEHRYDQMIKELSDTAWSSSAGVGGRQWMYQTCTEFGWYQSSDQPGHPYSPFFPVAFLERQCSDVFGPKFDLALLGAGVARSNTNYGARDIRVSNVVFVHGSIDPWHAVGITKDLS